MGDVLGCADSTDQGAGGNSLRVAGRNVIGKHDRSGLDTVDADAWIPLCQFDCQRSRHGFDRTFAGEIGGVIEIGSNGRPVADVDDRSARGLVRHLHSGCTCTQERCQRIDLEVTAYLVGRDCFQFRRSPNRGTVDQDIDTSKLSHVSLQPIAAGQTDFPVTRP